MIQHPNLFPIALAAISLASKITENHRPNISIDISQHNRWKSSEGLEHALAIWHKTEISFIPQILHGERPTSVPLFPDNIPLSKITDPQEILHTSLLFPTSFMAND